MTETRNSKYINVLSTGTPESPVYQILADVDFNVVGDAEAQATDVLHISDALQSVLLEKVYKNDTAVLLPGTYTLRCAVTIVGHSEVQDTEDK